MYSSSVGSALQSGAAALIKASTALSSLATGVQADLSPAAGIQVQALQAQIDSTTQALANTQDAYNTVNVAQAGLAQISDQINTIRTTALAAANNIGGPEVQAAYQQQIQDSLTAIQTIASNTQFNGKNLLDGSAGSGGTPLTFQTGPGAGQTASLSIEGAQPSQLGASVAPVQSLATIDVTTPQGAAQAVQIADAAAQQVATQSAQIGAFQSNTLAPTVNSLSQSVISLSETNSRLQDTNYGATVVELIKNQLLAKASLAVISQADQLQASALSLIKTN